MLPTAAEPENIPSAWPFGRKAAMLGAMQHCSRHNQSEGEESRQLFEPEQD